MFVQVSDLKTWFGFCSVSGVTRSSARRPRFKGWSTKRERGRRTVKLAAVTVASVPWLSYATVTSVVHAIQSRIEYSKNCNPFDSAHSSVAQW